MSTKDVSKEIADLLESARASLAEAERLSKEHHLPFSFQLDTEIGATYGPTEYAEDKHGYLTPLTEGDYYDTEAEIKEAFGEEYLLAYKLRQYQWNKWLSSSEQC